MSVVGADYWGRFVTKLLLLMRGRTWYVTNLFPVGPNVGNIGGEEVIGGSIFGWNYNLELP